jgi:hypothetical protein
MGHGGREESSGKGGAAGINPQPRPQTQLLLARGTAEGQAVPVTRQGRTWFGLSPILLVQATPGPRSYWW